MNVSPVVSTSVTPSSVGSINDFSMASGFVGLTDPIGSIGPSAGHVSSLESKAALDLHQQDKHGVKMTRFA